MSLAIPTAQAVLDDNEPFVSVAWAPQDQAVHVSGVIFLPYLYTRCVSFEPGYGKIFGAMFIKEVV
jgi:hypothetical protein